LTWPVAVNTVLALPRSLWWCTKRAKKTKWPNTGHSFSHTPTYHKV